MKQNPPTGRTISVNSFLRFICKLVCRIARLDMGVKFFVQLFLFFTIFVQNGLNCSEPCNSVTLNIQLGSEVLMPCALSKSNKTEEATWSQTSSLLSIRPHGNVTFEDPRDGRLTVFPFLFGQGNFSMLVHQFQASDMGIYCCRLSHECQKVEIKLLQNPEEKTEGLNFQWYYIALGSGIFVLLVLVFSLICILKGKCLKRSSDSYYVDSGSNQEQPKAGHREHAESSKVDECDGEYEDINSYSQEDYENAPGGNHDGQNEEQDVDYVNTERRRNCHDQYDSIGSVYPDEHHVKRNSQGQHEDINVYENEEYSGNQKKTKPPKATRFSKMQNQLPDSGQYYANQSMINKSCRAGKRIKDKEYQFKNPLYDQTPTDSK